MTKLDTASRPRWRQGFASPLLLDGVVGGALAVFLLLVTWATSQHHAGARPFDAGCAALLLFACGALVLRRRFPVAVLLAVLAENALYLLLGYPAGASWLTLVVAYVTAVAAGYRVIGLAVAAAGWVVMPWLQSLAGNGPRPTGVELAAVAAWLLVLFGIGEALRTRRERAAEAARIREEESLRRASEERLRIARDLHDVLAHNISVINVQAGVALHVSEELPPQLRDALTAIRQASRDALSEVRSALDVLRRSGEPAPRDPVPRMAQLDDLVARSRLGGLDVHLEIAGTAPPLDAGVDLAAYRIVQEALTNVIRHARAANAWVRVVYGSNELAVSVEDDGIAGPSGAAAAGSGITGMRERAAALGGTLEAGPRPGGGFRVAARLPLEAAQ